MTSCFYAVEPSGKLSDVIYVEGVARSGGARTRLRCMGSGRHSGLVG